MPTKQSRISKSPTETNPICKPSYMRISKIELNNFKSVKHGEILLDRGEQLYREDLQSDILGIYGQNGSGKTSTIEALSILSMAMSGEGITDTYSDCVSIDPDNPISTLKFTFNIYSPESGMMIVSYEFSLKKVALSEEELKEKLERNRRILKDVSEDFVYRRRYKIQLSDETVKMTKMVNGKKTRLETIITTSGNNNPFGPRNRLKEVLKNNTEEKIKLKINRENYYASSKSFVFCEDTIKMVYEYLSQLKLKENHHVLETLLLLQDFAKHRLRIVDARTLGVINMNFVLPILTKDGFIPLELYENRISEKDYNLYKNIFSNISTVLSQLVPGLSIELRQLSKSITSKGEPGLLVVPIARRGNLEIPLRDESDGIRKIISILCLIAAAYNDSSITIAIDEFDSGIFEYILGEILQSFEEDGKGQFIFTSHNLRPLEVLNKRFIVFTTTNPEKRYARFKDLSSTSNLRDSYYREIMLGGQEIPLYDETERYKIKTALRSAFEEK